MLNWCSRRAAPPTHRDSSPYRLRCVNLTFYDLYALDRRPQINKILFVSHTIFLSHECIIMAVHCDIVCVVRRGLVTRLAKDFMS